MGLLFPSFSLLIVILMPVGTCYHYHEFTSWLMLGKMR